jgi:hypothetical protein
VDLRRNSYGRFIERHAPQVEINLDKITRLDMNVVGVLNGIDKTSAILFECQGEGEPFNEINGEVRDRNPTVPATLPLVDLLKGNTQNLNLKGVRRLTFTGRRGGQSLSDDSRAPIRYRSNAS